MFHVKHSDVDNAIGSVGAVVAQSFGKRELRLKRGILLHCRPLSGQPLKKTVVPSSWQAWTDMRWEAWIMGLCALDDSVLNAGIDLVN